MLMTELQTLVDQLIETICENLDPNIQPTPRIIESFASPKLTSYALSLEQLKQKITDPEQKENPDRSLLMLLLKTVELIHPLTCNYIFLNETQQTQIKTALLELLTIFNSLLSTHEDSTVKIDGENESRGFIIDEDFEEKHIAIGQNINKKFFKLLDLAKQSPEDLSKKITDIINAYQKDVEPDFLRAENHRLKEEIKQLQAQATEQQKKIDQLTTQYITGVPKPTTNQSKQHRPLSSVDVLSRYKGLMSSYPRASEQPRKRAPVVQEQETTDYFGESFGFGL